jgi:hypothetical protein
MAQEITIRQEDWDRITGRSGQRPAPLSVAPPPGRTPIVASGQPMAPIQEDEKPHVPRGTVGSVLKALRTPQQALFLGPTLGAQRALQEGRSVTIGDILGGSREAVHQDLSFRDAAKRGGLEGGWATAAGLVGDIVLDPLNLVASPVKAVSQLGRMARIPQAARKVGLPEAVEGIKRTRPAQMLGRALVPDFGKSEEYLEIADRAVRNRANRTEQAVDLGRRLNEFSPQDQKRITVFLESTKTGKQRNAILRGASKGLETTNESGDNILELANEVRRADMALGDDLVKLGLMSKETLKAHRGSHVQRMYKEIETNPDKISETARQFFSERKKILTPRVDDPEKLKNLTRIEEAAYPVAKGQRQTGELVATRQFFKEISDKFTQKHTDEGLTGAVNAAATVKAMKRKGFELVPRSDIYGPLQNKYVPKAIHDDIIRAGKTGVSEWARRWQKGVGWWKYGKIVMNPASHFRNSIGNFVLADMAGLSPWKVNRYVDSMRSLTKKDEFYDLAKENGTFLTDTFVGHEIPALLNTADSLPQLESGLRQWAKGSGSKIFNNLSKLYQFEEQFFKQAFFIDQMKKSMRKAGKRSLDDLSSEQKASFGKAAAAAADEALFNYRKLPALADKMRRWGVVPFIAFPTKAVGATARSLGNRPQVIKRYGDVMRTFEPTLKEQGDERRALPEYMMENWMRLPSSTPFVKNEQGDPVFLNMEYILPWAELGDMAERARTDGWGEGFFGRGGQEPAFLNIPAAKIFSTIYSGVDPFTNRKVDDYPGGRKAYYWDQLAPPLMGRQGRELIATARGERLDPRRTYIPKKGLGEVVLGNIFGLRTTSRNIDESYLRKLKSYTNELAELEREMGYVRNREVTTERELKVQEDDVAAVMRKNLEVGKKIFELQMGRPPRDEEIPE